MDTKNSAQLTPWTSKELEALLRDLISHGTEIAKADFKSELHFTTQEEKSELLKDLTSIANTYGEPHNDYGFLIYGVKGKVIRGVPASMPKSDQLQSTIEDLLKTYVAPMLPIYVMDYETDDGLRWGAIVIPPRNDKPYMFAKYLQCKVDKSRTRTSGQWFVRRGTTTEPGRAEDLSRIMQRQTELLLDPLRESIRNLQARMSLTDERFSTTLANLNGVAIAGRRPLLQDIGDSGDAVPLAGPSLDRDLPARFKQRLRSPVDALGEELVLEAKSLREFLDGADTGLPWAPMLTDQKQSQAAIEDLERRMQSLLLSIGIIVLRDAKGTYTDAVLRCIKLLAKATEVPSGVSFNKIGESLRYYPLGALLYTVIVCGVAAGRIDLMKKALSVPLRRRPSGNSAHISHTFFAWYYAREIVNHAYGTTLCEPLPHRIRQWIREHIGEMLPETSEPEYFFRGEFVLALSHIDASITEGQTPEHQTPSAGEYLYLHEAREPIESFLLEREPWFDSFYANPLKNILNRFDANAHLVAAPNCYSSGLYGLRAERAYEKARTKDSGK